MCHFFLVKKYSSFYLKLKSEIAFPDWRFYAAIKNKYFLLHSISQVLTPVFINHASSNQAKNNIAEKRWNWKRAGGTKSANNTSFWKRPWLACLLHCIISIKLPQSASHHQGYCCALLIIDQIKIKLFEAMSDVSIVLGQTIKLHQEIDGTR